MKISVISPVKNEVDFIGYSVMSALPHVHEILYGIAPSNDGTEELLEHIQNRYAKDKLKLFWGNANGEPIWDFKTDNMEAYNKTYNYLVDHATGDAVWFLHPDMVITNPGNMSTLAEGPLAWWVHVASYGRDLNTKIAKGRTDKWKNIHAKKLGLHYFGGYGSNNEDFYHREITGNSYKHYGSNFDEYPFEIVDSGIHINHYCELKSFDRRLEKMMRCLRTQIPQASEAEIEAMARKHPRVTLESVHSDFGHFEFAPSDEAVPSVFEKFGKEFGAFKKVPKGA